jgi:hypothetical protein
MPRSGGQRPVQDNTEKKKVGICVCPGWTRSVTHFMSRIAVNPDSIVTNSFIFSYFSFMSLDSPDANTKCQPMVGPDSKEKEKIEEFLIMWEHTKWTTKWSPSLTVTSCISSHIQEFSVFDFFFI